MPKKQKETWDDVFYAYNNSYENIDHIKWIKEFLESEYIVPKRKKEK